MICEGIKTQLVGPTSRSKLLDRLTAVVLLVLAVAGCKQLQSLGRPTVLKSPDGKFQLTVPAGWRENASLNDQAQIKAAKPREEMYVIVITEPKSDFTDEMTLDEFTKVTRDAMISNITSPEPSAPLTITISGNESRQYEIQGAVKNVQLAYLVTTVETTSHYHQIIAWTLRSLRDKNQVTLKQVASSFRPVAGSTP